MDFSAISTMLFTPATRPERFDKAKETQADGLVIDLEDAVELSSKDSARKTVLDYLKSYKPDKNFLTCVRINSIKTPSGLKDISALIDSELRPDVLVLPKVEYAAEIQILDELLSPKHVPYIVLLETARGLFNAKEILLASKNVNAVVFGGGDLSADLGAELAWEPMLNARSVIVRAAANAAIAAFDVPYLNLKDTDDTKLIEETQRVKALGYTGKLAIHPKQVKPIIETFMPPPQAVEHAKKIVEIYENSGGKVCEINGKMIDVPIYKSAKRVLALAKKTIQ
jgi:citrate lyase beta subunit